MATFSTNQVKQLYVAKAVDASLDTVGDIKFSTAGDNQIAAKYVGNDGIVRTDLIDLATLKGKAIKASAMGDYLESAYIASTSAVAGQNYILKVTVDEFGGMTPEDKGFIFADYTAQSGDAAKNVLANLAISLANNTSKAAYNKLINVYVTTAATASTALTLNTNLWLVNAGASASTVAGYGSLTAIIIEAAEQPWVLGKIGVERVGIKVSSDPIMSSGIETKWATVTYNTAHPTAQLTNSKKIADLEYFAFGERGDVYRGAGWPNNFEFTPLVNPSAAYGYHVLELTWAYQGDCEDIQKSPKELVIAVPAEGATTYTAINAIIGTASSSAEANTLNKAIYDSGSSAFIAQLS